MVIFYSKKDFFKAICAILSTCNVKSEPHLIHGVACLQKYKSQIWYKRDIKSLSKKSNTSIRAQLDSNLSYIDASIQNDINFIANWYYEDF